MKVKFIKDHLRYRSGQVADIVDASANYFIKCGVAKEYVNVPKETKIEVPKKVAPSKKKRGK